MQFQATTSAAYTTVRRVEIARLALAADVSLQQRIAIGRTPHRQRANPSPRCKPRGHALSRATTPAHDHTPAPLPAHAHSTCTLARERWPRRIVLRLASRPPTAATTAAAIRDDLPR
eukprot:scaffold23301_cov74-Phaeocystis_antarctica.AAC.2